MRAGCEPAPAGSDAEDRFGAGRGQAPSGGEASETEPVVRRPEPVPTSTT